MGIMKTERHRTRRKRSKLTAETLMRRLRRYPRLTLFVSVITVGVMTAMLAIQMSGD